MATQRVLFPTNTAMLIRSGKQTPTGGCGLLARGSCDACVVFFYLAWAFFILIILHNSIYGMHITSYRTYDTI